jgi:Helix-turn-helix of DDE superfamily endonuclease
MTGLTQPEFTALLPHFEHAFLAYRQEHTIDGQPRASRRYSTYDTSSLPTMADQLLCILTYLKQNASQAVQGQLFGMSQSNANKWLHLLHIRIEHAIGGVKRDRIVKDKIRLFKDGLRDTIMETCCELHNFRLQYRPWRYAS